MLFISLRNKKNEIETEREKIIKTIRRDPSVKNLKLKYINSLEPT